jgi:hypothetical protein
MKTRTQPTATPKVTTSIVEITPDIAASWLALFNAGNRRARADIVKKYARFMTAGEWAVTDQCISFDIENNLLNGQHRLMAVVQSGVTIMAMVARNMPKDSFKYMDQGAFRNNCDIHGVSKHFNSFLAGLIKHVGGYKVLNHTQINNARIYLTRQNITLEELIATMNNGTTVKIVTSGYSRFAAAFCCDHYGDPDYTINLMKDLIRADRSVEALRELSPRAFHFMRLIKNRTIGSWNAHFVLSKALDLYNPNRRNIKNIVDAPDEVVLAAREWAKKVIGG